MITELVGTRRRTRQPLVWLVLAWTGALCLAYLVTAFRPGDTFAGWYNASAYFVSYRDGFVRRGLVGALLEFVLGRPPGPVALAVVGIGLVLLAAVALAALTVLTARLVANPADRLVTVALVVASPFTFSLLVQNRGRYDLIELVCLALMAVLALRRDRPVLRVLGIALLVLVGVAGEEIAVVFLLPVAAVAVARIAGVRWVVPALLPGVVLAAASFLVRPEHRVLAGAARRAAAAGLPITMTEENSISALSQSLGAALAFTAYHSPWSIALCAVVLGGAYALSGYVLWRLTGRVRGLPAVAAALALGALLLSVVGDDYRRWWGMAFVALLAALVVLHRGPGIPAPRAAEPARWRRVVLGVLLVSACLQVFPLWPRWDAAEFRTSTVVGHGWHP